MHEFDVIVVGAGVVGPAISTALARQNRKVLLIERDWSKPDRIVGELLQPGGIKALQSLGIVEAIQNIEAIPVKGYNLIHNGQSLIVDYPEKGGFKGTSVPHCVDDRNFKIVNDSTLKSGVFNDSSRELGVAFRHGEFISNLRNIAKREANITCLKGTVTKLEKDSKERVVGVRVNEFDTNNVLYKASLTICCDGIFSKFRKTLGDKNISTVESHFISMELQNVALPKPNYGHVIISEEAPVLIYQISPSKTRVLCAYRSSKLPSVNSSELQDYLHDTIYNKLPESLRDSYKWALQESKIRAMPNSYLIAKKNTIAGLLVLGDALNMRHPLTGGGMTVGLNDAALIAKLIAPEVVPDLNDQQKLLSQFKKFHYQRKASDSVINVLSISLYSLFSANNRYLRILQFGCFEYLKKVQLPIALLSGLMPKPFDLFKHFFATAFYSIYTNFTQNGLVMLPISIYESILTLYTAIVVFTPYMWNELVS